MIVIAAGLARLFCPEAVRPVEYFDKAWAGYMDGGVSSGRRAAEEVLESIGGLQ